MDEPEWVKFKKTFTQKQEDAIWQYFIDHSKIQKNGFYGFMFYLRDVDDFWKRVHSRFTGEFSRYNKLEKAEKMAWLSRSIEGKMHHEWQRRVEAIDKGKNPFKKFILYIHRLTRGYISSQ